MFGPVRDRSRGQALAEVALVAPLFFLMVFGIIDLGLFAVAGLNTPDPEPTV